MEIKIPGDLSTASERGWRWRKICSPKNEMKNSYREAVYHNAYFYFSLISIWHFCENAWVQAFRAKTFGCFFFWGGGAMYDWLMTAWPRPVITTSFRPKRS